MRWLESEIRVRVSFRRRVEVGFGTSGLFDVLTDALSTEEALGGGDGRLEGLILGEVLEDLDPVTHTAR